jgi:DNA-binding MarR family transcriptional regulator
MSNPFEELATLDRLVHDPARLSILSALAACKSADFLFLQRLTALTGGNLSGHLAKLEEAGLVQIQKRFIERRPNTQVSLTSKGRATLERHWQQLESLRKSAQEWKPE